MSTSRLPPEILNTIVCLSSCETRARIACLNIWFHQAFGKILYRDIHIRSALQLVKLFRSAKVIHNLAGTRKLAIERSAFWSTSWEGIHRRLKRAEYLGRILQMTTSLRQLDIEYTYSFSRFQPSPDWESESLFTSEIWRRASNPSFLPRLARIQSPNDGFILPLCRGRPIEYLSNNQESDLVVHQSGAYFHPAGISPTRVSLNILVMTGYGSFGWNTRGVATPLEKISYQGVIVKHLELVLFEWGILTPSHGDLLSWVTEISSKSGHEHLESLCIVFEPPIAGKLVDVQFRTLKQAICRMPNLTHALLGSPDAEWRRYSGEQPGLPSSLPDWTPCPSRRDPGVLSWWLDTLGPCNSAKAMKGDPEGTGQLRDSMLTRWDETLVPSVEVLQARLSTMVSSSV